MAGLATVLVGAGLLFRFLWLVLGDRVVVIAAAIVGISIALAIPTAVLLRRRPALAERLRRRPEAAASPHVVGTAGRVACAVLGLVFLAVALLGGWVMWSAPDLAILAALWALPAAYLALTALWIAASGRSDGQPEAALFWLLLWPW